MSLGRTDADVFDDDSSQAAPGGYCGLLAGGLAAPFVVIEALIDAMAASGHALVIPLLAGAAGFMAPGVRRKHLPAEALDKNPEPVPSNEPRTVFIGW